MEIIIVIAAVVAAYLIWTHLTKEVAVPKDLVQTNKLEDDLTAFTTAPYKVPEPAATTPVPMFVPPVVEPVAEPVAEKPKRKPAARTVVAKTAAPKKTVAKPAAAKKTAAAKKPAAKKKSV